MAATLGQQHTARSPARQDAESFACPPAFATLGIGSDGSEAAIPITNITKAKTVPARTRRDVELSVCFFLLLALSEID
jgi:hypothetical protein